MPLQLTRKNRRDFLTEVKNKKLQNRGATFSMQRDDITATAWKDYFLTSGCQPAGDNVVQRRKKDASIPDRLDYQATPRKLDPASAKNGLSVQPI